MWEYQAPALVAAGCRCIAPSLFAATGGEPVSAALVQWVVGMALQASSLATLACLRAFPATDLRPELGAVTVPTLVIHGDQAASQPIAVARAAAAVVAGARLVEYGGAPHGLFLTERRRLAADLVAFARGEPAPGAVRRRVRASRGGSLAGLHRRAGRRSCRSCVRARAPWQPWPPPRCCSL